MRSFGRGRLALAVCAVAVGIVAIRGALRSANLPPSSDRGASVDGGAASGSDIEVSGCAALASRADGLVCELPADGALRIWVRGPRDAVAFHLPGRAPPAVTVVREVQGGALHRVVVPEDATELRIGALRTLSVARRTIPGWLENARSLRQRGDLDAAAALAQSAKDASEPVDRARALGFLARIELAAGRADASFPLFREAVAFHRVGGRLSEAADDSFALAFALNQRSHRYTEARAVLDETRAHLGDFADGWAREAYYRGTLATEIGDPRSALRLLREARERAERVGLDTLARNATNAIALQLELVGQLEEALRVLSVLDDETTAAADASACEKVEIAINRGFGAILVRERSLRSRADAGSRAGIGAGIDAVAPLRRALSGLGDRGCTDRYLAVAARGNLAHAALLDGDLTTARKTLAEARGDSDPAMRAIERLSLLDLGGRIALAGGDAAGALSAFEEEGRLAGSVVSDVARWRAALGRGEALERLRRPDDALVAYREAEDALGAASLLVPLGEGRGTFASEHDRSAIGAVDLLVRLGRVESAFTLARGARSRVLAGLAQRDRIEGLGPAERARWEAAIGAYRSARAAIDAEAMAEWQLARPDAIRARTSRTRREATLRATLDDALALLARPGASPVAGPRALPSPGTLTLAVYPLRAGFVGFAADEGGVISFPIPDLPTDDAGLLSHHLLAPLEERLGRATRLRVLAYGPLRTVDVHALPYEGAPLVAKLPVEYALDLPDGGSDPRPAVGSAGRRRALLVSDPRLDLASAGEEVADVRRSLGDAGGWDVESLEGANATSAAVGAQLGSAALLHYAGHGIFRGREGWESTLPLAGMSHLTIGDILAAPMVPPVIVLSGCETARGGAEAIESLGLAQAFLVAGASVVIAPVRPVADRLASRVARGLYRGRAGIAGAGSVDAAGALRETLLEARSEDPSSDWAAFRVVRR